MNSPKAESLLAISPLDGRYQPKTRILQDYFSEFALFKFRFQVEANWLYYLLNEHEFLGIKPPEPEALKALKNLSENFSIEDAITIKELEYQYRHDVKAVEYFLKDSLRKIPDLMEYQEWVHFGCTSEDINNLAYGLMIKTGLKKIIVPKIEFILSALKIQAHQMAHLPMLARTHGQAATPTTLGKEWANFAYRLELQLNQLINLPVYGKFNGAVGNYNAFYIAMPQIDWLEFNKNFVLQLGLGWNPYTTQIEPHDYVADILNKLSQINTILIDLARDCWSYISLGYFSQLIYKNEVGSSTMPHKVNPIDFENAEGNLSMSQALAQFLANRLPLSRYQRDLVDSTLMRNIGSVFAYGIIAYESLLSGFEKIKPNAAVLSADLEAHTEILSEAIQTVMRAHHLAIPYEQLKQLTQGQKVNLATLHDFINTLDLPDSVKKHLLELKPEHYLGYAKQLAEKI